MPSIEPQMASGKPSKSIRFAYGVGIALIGSGLLHVPIWLLSGTEWSGDVSWRKPILFGISTGVTVASIAWVCSKIRMLRADGPLLVAFAVALTIEVFLISLQQWRGVASHFNRSTPIDATILTIIEVLITFATIVIVYLTVRVWGKLDTTPAMKFAIRAGMLMLVLGCLLGFAITYFGYQSLAAGGSPGIFGQRGVLKFPHGIPLHAIQLLPLLVVLARLMNAAQSTRLRVVQSGTVLTTGFTLFGILQTFSGKARFEFWPVSAAILLLTLIASLATLWPERTDARR